MRSWGLGPALEQKSVAPTQINWRRWQNGALIGCAKLGQEVLQRFGSPYYVTHRADLHNVLHDHTRKLEIPIELNKKVEGYAVNEGRVTFADGTSITADLVIAADGERCRTLRNIS